MLEHFLSTDWLEVITKIILATALGYLIGSERELHGKVVGTRTISLIAIGSALYVLMSPSIIGGDNSRIIAQVVSGIGFLGAGIIFKDGDTVKGLTTAATVWCAAAIGCLIGFGYVGEAVLGTLAVMTVNIFFKHLRPEHSEQQDKHKD
jgi:putative Mg2+ transporter-C (MgtC) family protein